MRVVTYNIRLGLDSTLAQIASVVRSLEPDIVCLQEVGRDWVMGDCVDMQAVLCQGTGLQYGIFAPAIHRGAAQYGIALLSHRPIEVVAQFILPVDTDEPRTMLACVVGQGRQAALVVTSHISVVPGDRPAQFETIGDWLSRRASEPTRPLIVMGDLNAELGDRDLAGFMAQTGLRSAVLDVLGETPPTYPTVDPELAIDHILVPSRVKVSAAAVCTVLGSDHLPVWADLELHP